MKISGNFLAYLVLTTNAVMRTVIPAHMPPSNNHESQVSTENKTSGVSKSVTVYKHKFYMSSGRRRRPYIQFEDGSYQVLWYQDNKFKNKIYSER